MGDTSASASTGERLAKVMARAGLCSRRVAETWISAGRVTVNDISVTSPATTVTEADRVCVDGEPLPGRQTTRLWLYHKPAGLMVTERDPEGRPTIFERLAEAGLPRVMSVGRLDFNSEGLLLLTNDGGLKRVLEMPSTGWLRRYRVRAFGAIDPERLAELAHGITIDRVHYGPIEASLERRQGGNQWLTVAMREGKNREIKNVLGALGLKVNRLIRISFGPFQLGELKPGELKQVRSKILRDQLGARLARAAGVRFDAPVGQASTARPRPPRPRRRSGARTRG
jgi:23S rRNA pseudouridine2605 synthase